MANSIHSREHLLRSVLVDLLLHGAVQAAVVTALQLKVSSEMCDRFTASAFAAILVDGSVVT